MATKNISKAQELRELKADDIQKKLTEAKEELFNLRFQAATGQLESHGRLKAVRREIARIYTVMRERELGIIADVEPDADESEESSDDSTAGSKSKKAKKADQGEKQAEGVA